MDVNLQIKTILWIGNERHLASFLVKCESKNRNQSEIDSGFYTH